MWLLGIRESRYGYWGYGKVDVATGDTGKYSDGWIFQLFK
jgi:hypothetical protein